MANYVTAYWNNNSGTTVPWVNAIKELTARLEALEANNTAV